MKETKFKLLGSTASGAFSEMYLLLGKYFCEKPIGVFEIQKTLDGWDIYRRHEKLSGFRIIQKGKRLRFEGEIQDFN